MEPLVESPVFMLNLPRSGSNLLRCVLDSHPLVHVTEELHFTNLKVNMTAPFAELAMKMLGFDSDDLEHMLWDRILHDSLIRSGKKVIIEKTPRDLLQWERFHRAWPAARYIFLLRHPATIYASMEDSRSRIRARSAALREAPLAGPHADLITAMVHLAASRTESSMNDVVDRVRRLNEARRVLPGFTVRYEDLVGDTEQVTREACDFLNVPWDAAMLDHGAVDRTLVRAEFDPADKIKSGRIVEPRAVPVVEDIPPELIPACREWGYN
jgi:hypothetical protein